VVEGYVVLDEQFTTINSGIGSSNGLIYESLDSISQGENMSPLRKVEAAHFN